MEMMEGRAGSHVWAAECGAPGHLALWTASGTRVAPRVLPQRLRAPPASTAKAPADRHSSTFPTPLSWDQNEDLGARAPAQECAGHLRQGGSPRRGQGGHLQGGPWHLPLRPLEPHQGGLPPHLSPHMWSLQVYRHEKQVKDEKICAKGLGLSVHDTVKLSYNLTDGLRERGGNASCYHNTKGTEEENDAVTKGLSSKLALYSAPNILVTGGQCKSTGQSHRPATESWLHHS